MQRGEKTAFGIATVRLIYAAEAFEQPRVLVYDVPITFKYSVETGIYVKWSTGLPLEQRLINFQPHVNSRVHPSLMLFQRNGERTSNIEMAAHDGCHMAHRATGQTAVMVMFHRHAANVSAVVHIH